MAKKKKVAKKAPATRAAKAPARKKAPAKSKPKGPPNPSMISTGRGPSPAEVGADLVAMFNRGKLQEIEAKYHADSLVSVEGVGVSMAWSGRKAVQAKNEGWLSTHRLHGASAEGPYVGATGFSVKFTMDVEDTTDSSRVMMEEVGVYTVQNGKIVREEFMYGCATPIPQQPAGGGSST